MTSLRGWGILRTVPLVIAAWIFYGGLPVCTQAQIVYQVIDLGTLGGDLSGASSINDLGQIVGSSYDSEGRHRAALFDATGAGNNIDLGALGGTSSWGFSINDAGQIVGSAFKDRYSERATLFDPTGGGNNIDLGTLPGWASAASCINNVGQIVGYTFGDFGRAVLFDPTGAGNNIDLGIVAGYKSGAYSINDAGQIVGRENYCATLFDPTGAGNNINLGTLPGSEFVASEAVAINNAGQIVGHAEIRPDYSHATLFDPTGSGNNTDLGTLGGDHSYASSINDLGQIVGSSGYTPGDWDARATLFDPTGAGNNIDLNTLIDPASGWTLLSASDINNSGWIVGGGINPQGFNYAFLLVPIPTKYSGGTGEPNDPYRIATAEDLMLLGETPEDYDKHFILTADIDLDPNLPERKVFDRAVIAADMNDTESHFQGTPFNGVFEGNGHTISHLTITGEGYLGLFGGLHYQAKVLDLGLEAVDINGTGNEIGSLAGSNSGSIAGCYSIGTVNGGAVVGGLVGGSDGTITNSHSDGTVKGTGNCVGGLVGANHLLGSITTCYSTGTVSGEDAVGGLVGINISGNIIDSHSICVVSGEEDVGGLVGDNRPASDSYPESRVVSCWSASSVTGSICVGGLVGCNEDSCITMSYSTGSTVGGDWAAGGLVGVNRYGDITMSYSKSTVSGEDRVGGLVGSGAGGITKCYSVGAVIGDELVGGLVGSFDANDVVLSFWDIENSGLLTSDGGTGKTTAEMQTASTFIDAGWDFVNVWDVGENQTYPYLRKYSAADINQDETVDFADLAILAENWLADNAP